MLTKLKLTRMGCGNTQQTQRRHYTPRNISQQAVVVNLPDEQPINNSNIETCSSSSHNLSLHLPVSRDYKHTGRELLSRPLGGIEQMYNIYSSQGTDIICLMTKIETIYPVTSSAVTEALNLLQQRHPLFRMSIRKSRHYDDGHMDFVEKEKASFDFAVYDRLDWLQCLLDELDYHSTGKSRSLIRCRMLNSSSITNKSKEASRIIVNECKEPALEENREVGNSEKEFDYQATFLFIMHHSIMDGGYSLWMFQEFVNFLDAVVMNIDIGHVKELPLLPPFENIFTFNCDGNDGKNVELKDCALSFCHDSTDDTLLKAYNRTFRDEIDISPKKKLRNNCIVFKFSKIKTRTFVQMIKSKKCTPKGAIIAASTLALLELVYQDKTWEMCNNCSIPIEYMADFRRVGEFHLPDKSVPHYPGVAALHIPLLAQLRLGGSKITTEIFWKIAQQFGECLDQNVDSPELFEWIKEEAAKYNRFPVQPEVPGKSPYVLSISNMGKIDGVLNSDVSGRVRLVDLHGHSNILVDEMPLFCITTFALNGHFCGNVSFCSNYTTNKTATKYVGLFQKYLCSYSML
ncbi:uncharacterized protein LOC123528949 [Mercenaria mercenaria]|uniref:uncharacterized protein LOC123528949 n=1 Tax=Mercenaria mercenaria TaxID=6596 RepID=UPI00234E51B2|nr:uncharacterized protein LOC123528949 [Mercenaria mercenaria]XP_045164974.2 uncharacterized protein LOC123528949 [Mercenaria mercenaria]XP_045164975.2 uncharacterized protein LOC123528949 [Mercenaria mercenaria]XP_053377559.1 uncharacterized protein LOC123528949 [Mercenaria mercenaria]